jgi:glycogen operon protein
VIARRAADIRALLATLFASTGTIMLTAGDEFGRTQSGNNNAYCQFMPIDWTRRDLALESEVAALSAARAARLGCFTSFPEGGRWLSLGGDPLHPHDWESLATSGFVHQPPQGEGWPTLRVDRNTRSVSVGG